MLLLLFFGTQAAPAQPGYVNLALAEQDLWPALNATSANDAIYWNDAEIFNWFDEAAKRMARQLGVFVVYDQSLSSVLGNSAYTLPASHVNTIQADLAGFVLRPRTLHELEALDATWNTTAGPPTAFVEDTQGLQQIALYPAPDAPNSNKAIGLVMQQLPPDISVSAAILNAPQCMREYYTFWALAEARMQESPAAMPEVAQWLRGLVGIMDQTIAGLWK